MFKRSLLVLAFAAAALTGAAHARGFTIGQLTVEQPWSRPAAQGGNGAGFLTVTNAGNTADALIAASSPVARRVEIHESMVMNGRAMMHPRPGGLEIPAGGAASLKPGGWHLMLIGLKRPLKVGDRFPATLTFRNAGKTRVEFVVQAGVPAPGSPPHH